jgi:hypothetical protein
MNEPGMGEDEDDIDEAFQIFKEQIEDEDEEEALGKEAPPVEVKEQDEVKDEEDEEEGKEEEVKV